MASLLGALGLRSPSKAPTATLAPDDTPVTAPSNDLQIVMPPDAIESIEALPQKRSSKLKRRRSDGLYNYTIQVQCNTGESFDIHQGLLFESSKEFARLTESNDPDVASGVMKIDHEFKTVHAMKEFLYKGQLPGHEYLEAHFAQSLKKDDSDDDDDNLDTGLPSRRAAKKQRTDTADQDDTVSSDTQAESTTKPTIMGLTKLLVLAEALTMTKLRKEVAAALIYRLDLDHDESWDSPIDALIFTHDHRAKAPLACRMLSWFVATQMLSHDYMRSYGADLSREIILELLEKQVIFFENIRIKHEIDPGNWDDIAAEKELSEPSTLE